MAIVTDDSGVSTTNLELYLAFDGDLLDSSGNTRHQTANVQAGIPTFIDDGDGAPTDSYAEFSYPRLTAIDTSVEAMGSATLFATSGDDWTVSLFVQFKGSSANGAGTLVSRAKGTGTFGIQHSVFFVHITQDRRLLVRIRGQDNFYQVPFSDRERHHIAVVWDGTAQTATVYIDDVSQGSALVGGVGDVATNIWIAGSELLDAAVPATSHLSGRLAEFRIYNEALSANSVHLLYLYGRPDDASAGSGADIQFGDLELWLEFEDDLTDSSANERDQDANLANGPLVYVPGKVNNKASEWDATSLQYIDTGVTNVGACRLFSDVSNVFTVSVWVKNNDPSGGIGMVISRRMSSTGFRLQVTNGGANVSLRGQLNNYTLTGNDDGNWHHYSVTWDGSAAAFYYDKVAQSVPTNGSDTEGTENILIGTVDAVGGGNPANYALHFDEHMDDLRLYGRGLTSGDVTEIFDNSTLSPLTVALDITAMTAGGVATISVTFNHDVTTFVAGDVSATNATIGTPTGSGTDWSFAATTTADGLVSLQIAAAAVTDDDGRNNEASNLLKYGVGGVDDPTNSGLDRFDRTAVPNFTATVTMGPIQISKNAAQRSMVTEIFLVLGNDSDAVGTVAIATGVTAEDAIAKTVAGTEQWSATIAQLEANFGRGFPRIAGHAVAIQIDVTSGHLVYEELDLLVANAGRNRGIT